MPIFAKYTFDHTDCVIRTKKSRFKNDTLKTLYTQAHELLKERSFETKDFVSEDVLLPNELYFVIEQHFVDDKLFNECLIDVKIKKSKRTKVLKSDPIVFEKSTKRRVPRITLKGMERCRFALKEAFIHIPHCIKAKN